MKGKERKAAVKKSLEDRAWSKTHLGHNGNERTVKAPRKVTRVPLNSKRWVPED